MISRIGLTLALVVLAVAAACGAPAPTPGPTVPPVCVAIPAVYAQIDALQALDPATATTAEVQSAVANLQSSWVNLRVQAQAASQAGFTELDAAITRLSVAAVALPPTTTPAEAVEQLSDELDAVATAADQLQTELGCPPL